MTGPWYMPGTRGFAVLAAVSFLALEFALRLKLGSIWFLVISWVISHQWLAERIGLPSPFPEPGRKYIYALNAALWVSAVVFVVFGVMNIGFRTMDNDWQWFQLP